MSVPAPAPPRFPARLRSALSSFIASESLAGVILMVAALAAMILANSPLGAGWQEVLHIPVGGLTIEKWINDGLMAVFFLLVGLEIKREVREGQLSSWRRCALPVFAAAGGMMVPALIYAGVNIASPQTLRGWAIPAATDIAFALGVLALLGSRVPVSLKIFLTALAIIDDLGAIGIIAVFYTHDLSWMALAGAALMLLILFVLNRLHVMNLWLYLIPAVALWWFMHQSGIHATLAGVAVAMMIPSRRWPARPERPQAPLHVLEHALHPWVTFLILPVFALANAGVALRSLSLPDLAAPAPLGVLLGLFVGKQIGVFAATWAAVRFGLADKPHGASWVQIYGVAILCGVGFTMSLFISFLAFPRSPELIGAVKMGVLAGSILSALVGAALLGFVGRKGVTSDAG
jgi:NhaA family Na+:H+ antiporter